MKLLDARSLRMKERYQDNYIDANREVKRQVRTDKHKYLEDLTTQAEEAAV